MCTGCDRISESVGFLFRNGGFDRANYLTVILKFCTSGRELIERDMPAFESPCFKHDCGLQPLLAVALLYGHKIPNVNIKDEVCASS